MTEIIKVKDNIITEHSFVNRELSYGEIAVKDFNGNVGDNISLYDENWNIIPVAETTSTTSTTTSTTETETETETETADIDKEEESHVESQVESQVESELKEPELSYYPPYTRTDELMLQLDTIDISSVRAIRAILSGTDTEEDHKILKALEKQAINLRQELNTVTAAADTTDTTKVDTDAVTNAVTNK